MSNTRLEAATPERIPLGGEELAAYQRAVEAAKGTIAELRRVIVAKQEELDKWQATGLEAARAVLQTETRADVLESQLGQAHVEIAQLEAELIAARLGRFVGGELFPPPEDAGETAVKAIGLAKKKRESEE